MSDYSTWPFVVMAVLRKMSQARSRCGWGADEVSSWGFKKSAKVRGHVVLTPLNRLVLVSSIVVLASVSLGTGFAWAGFTGTLITSPLIGIFRAVGTALFLGAGVLRLAQWGVDGDPVGGVTGTALLMYGGAALPLTTIATSLSGDHPSSVFSVIVRWLATLMVLVVLTAALHWPERIKARADLARLAARPMAVVVGGFLLLLLAQLREPEMLDGGRWPYLALELTLVAGWLAVGAQAVILADRAPWGVRMAPVLTSMGIAELLRISGQPVWAAAAALLIASVAVLVVISSLHDLVTAISTQHDGTRALSEALERAQDAALVQHEWRAGLTHDARNTLAGLRATLEAQGRGLDSSSSDRLRLAAIVELRHLEQMIESGEQRPVDFDVAEVVRSAVDVRRATGLPVQLHCRPARAHGRPGDFARAVQNLLVNAQQHGMGRDVTVNVEATPQHVEVHVADRGPGLAVDSDPFIWGARGQHSQGSGVGLAISRRLLRRQGGDLVVQDQPVGARFTVRLPLAQARVIEATPIRLPRQTSADKPAAEVF